MNNGLLASGGRKSTKKLHLSSRDLPSTPEDPQAQNRGNSLALATNVTLKNGKIKKGLVKTPQITTAIAVQRQQIDTSRLEGDIDDSPLKPAAKQQRVQVKKASMKSQWKILKPKVENFSQQSVSGAVVPIVGQPSFTRFPKPRITPNPPSRDDLKIDMTRGPCQPSSPQGHLRLEHTSRCSKDKPHTSRDRAKDKSIQWLEVKPQHLKVSLPQGSKYTMNIGRPSENHAQILHFGHSNSKIDEELVEDSIMSQTIQNHSHSSSTDRSASRDVEPSSVLLQRGAQKQLEMEKQKQPNDRPNAGAIRAEDDFQQMMHSSSSNDRSSDSIPAIPTAQVDRSATPAQEDLIRTKILSASELRKIDDFLANTKKQRLENIQGSQEQLLLNIVTNGDGAETQIQQSLASGSASADEAVSRQTLQSSGPEAHIFTPVNEASFGKPAVKVLNLEVRQDFSQLRKSLAMLKDSRYASTTTGGRRVAFDGLSSDGCSTHYMEKPSKLAALNKIKKPTPKQSTSHFETAGRNIFMQLGSKLRPVQLEEMYDNTKSQTQTKMMTQTFGRLSQSMVSQAKSVEPLSVIGSKKRVTNMQAPFQSNPNNTQFPSTTRHSLSQPNVQPHEQSMEGTQSSRYTKRTRNAAMKHAVTTSQPSGGLQSLLTHERSYGIEGVDLGEGKTRKRAVIQQKADLFYSQEASLAEMSIEAIIQSQRYHKNRDQLLYRMKAEEGLDFDDYTLSQQVPPIKALGLNVDHTVRSELFPPRGPIRAQEHGLHNFNRREIKRQRENRVLAHSTRQKSESLNKWFTSNANPANRLRDVFSSSFKTGSQPTTAQNASEFQVSSKPSTFKSHVNPTVAMYERSPRGFSQQTLQDQMKDASRVQSFLSPTKNINRYKAFPQWTEKLSRAKLGEGIGVPVNMS